MLRPRCIAVDSRRWLFLPSVALLLLGASGCATYSDRLQSARVAVAAGQFEAGIAEMNSALGVSSSEELPSTWKGDRGLAALERGVLQQAIGDFENSARDLSAADQELELLDLTPDAIGNIGAYVYSDSATVYRIPPTERLALNAVNMLNFLAVGDASGAGVEARRFTVMSDYLASMEESANGAFGSYLAGFTFEVLGDGNRALRYYEEALEQRQLETLRAPVSRLVAANPHRGPGIDRLLASAGEGSPDARAASGTGEVLIVMSLGRVPYKIPERMAIGAAIGIAGVWVTGNASILEHSIFKTLAYPELTSFSSIAQVSSVKIDDAEVSFELLIDHGAEIRSEYESIKPRIIGSALSRMIVRAGGAEAARLAGQQAGGVGGIVGLAAALVTEGTLVALDRPDTRSWSFLADRVYVARERVASGEHAVQITAPGSSGDRATLSVSVPAGGYSIVVVTDPR